MNNSVQVNPQDMRNLMSTLDKVAATTRKSFEDLVKGCAIRAIQTASRVTKPETARPSVKSMPKKYRTRPVESLPRPYQGEYWFYSRKDKSKIFSLDHEVTEKRKRDIKHVKYGILFWNKKKSGWGYYPTAEKSGSIVAKRKKIPHAGAGKVGWFGALPKLGQALPDAGDNQPSRLSRVDKVIGGGNNHVKITNMVDYVAKTSPGSAARGIQAAEGWLRHSFLPEFQNKLKKYGVKA